MKNLKPISITDEEKTIVVLPDISKVKIGDVFEIKSNETKVAEVCTTDNKLVFTSWDLGRNAQTIMKSSIKLEIGEIVDGWIYCGWIQNPPAISTYEKLKENSLRSDHGEVRITVDRIDGSGCNCFYKEK